jgi:type VI secretion system protein ImpA
MRRVAEAADKACAQAAPAPALATTPANGVMPASAVLTAAAAPQTSGAINSREDALRGLERICEWIERNEPASPAPIFIRRSQQLLRKSFIDIIRDLIPDGVNQIEHFVGRSGS